MDKIIVDILFENSQQVTDFPIGYNQLLKKVNEKFKEIKGSRYKKVSRDKYNFHLKRLVEGGILERKETGRKDGSVNYYLSSKAKQEKTLQILEFKSKREQQNYLNNSEETNRTRLFFLLFDVLAKKK